MSYLGNKPVALVSPYSMSDVDGFLAAVKGLLNLGQCRLAVASPTSLKLSPYNGQTVIVNGVVQMLPAGGLALANAGLQEPVAGASFSITGNVVTYVTAVAHGLVVGGNAAIYNSALPVLIGNWPVLSTPSSTSFTFALTHANVASTADAGSEVAPIYYAYLAVVASVLTMVADQIGHVTGANGVEVKIGDPSKTLVGMFMLNASGQFVDSISQRLCLSYFNRADKTGIVQGNTAFNFSNPVISEVSTALRVQFLQWADESVFQTFDGECSNTAVGVSLAFQSSIDGSSAVLGTGSAMWVVNANSGILYSTTNSGAGAALNGPLTEGLHYSTLFASTGGGTGSVLTYRNSMKIRG